MATGNDRRLIERILSGDKAAFGEILDAHEAPVYRLALRYTDGVSDAEDLTQDIFLAVYASLPKFQGRSAFGTWVYRIALNHCLEFQRKRRFVSVPIEENLMLRNDDRQADPLEFTHQKQIARQVEEALNSLSPLHRDVVVLHELQGLTYQEVADALDVPVGTVKSRLSNAFRRLRDRLAGSMCEGMS
ncbi:RNA polymerase sigma factor [Armatimonadota bacterium]|nr:RNA polymerase sigma factor [Armatimonadota bacterium]